MALPQEVTRHGVKKKAPRSSEGAPSLHPLISKLVHGKAPSVNDLMRGASALKLALRATGAEQQLSRIEREHDRKQDDAKAKKFRDSGAGILGSPAMLGTVETPKVPALKGFDKYADRTLKDFTDLPVQIPVGLYHVGDAINAALPKVHTGLPLGYKGRKGDTTKLSDLWKGLRDDSVTGQLLYHGEILDPLQGRLPHSTLKLAGEHPGLAALELTGDVGLAGRLTGAGARFTPKAGAPGSTLERVTTKVRAAGSTERAPLKAGGNVEKTRHYSKNIFTKGFQVSLEKAKRSLGHDPDVMPRDKANRYFRQRMAAVGQMNQVLRRTARQEAKDVMHEAAPGSRRLRQPKHTQLLGLMAQKAIRSPETLRDDLLTLRHKLTEVRHTDNLEPWELRANDKLVKGIEDALRDKPFMADPHEWFDAAKTYIEHRTKADAEKKRLGLQSDAQEAAKQLPALATHLEGFEHNPHIRVETPAGQVAHALRESIKDKESELRAVESQLATRKLRERGQLRANQVLERRGKALPGDGDVARVRQELRDLHGELARVTGRAERHARKTGKLEGKLGERLRVDEVAKANRMRARQATPKEFERPFKKALEDPEMAPFLDEYTPAERAQQKLLLSRDGKAGAAVTPDGNIVSVFRLPGGEPGAGRAMLRAAVAAGGHKLDALGQGLRKFYESEGFRVTHTADWDPKYGKPPAGIDPKGAIVFMEYAPGGERGAAAGARAVSDAGDAERGPVARAGDQHGGDVAGVSGADVSGLGRRLGSRGDQGSPLADLSSVGRHGNLLDRVMAAYEKGGKAVDERRALRDAIKAKQRELVDVTNKAPRLTKRDGERLSEIRDEIRQLEADAHGIADEIAGHKKALKAIKGKEKYNPRFFLDGEPVTIERAGKLLKDLGIDPDEIGFLSHNPRTHGARAYHQTWDRRPDMAQGRRTLATFNHGAADSSWQAMTDDLAGALGKVEAAKAWDRAAREFGAGMFNGRRAFKDAETFIKNHGLEDDYMVVRIAPLRAKSEQVEKILADIEKGDTGMLAQTDIGGIMQAAHDAAIDPTGPLHGPVMVVPKAAMREWRQVAVGMSSTDSLKAFQVLSQNFRRVVLPFSTRWLAGNVLEAGFRSLLYGHGPFDLLRGVKTLKMLRAYDAKHGTDWADQFVARTLGGRLYGSHGRDKLHRGAAQFAEGSRLQKAARIGGTAARAPGIKLILGGMRHLQNAIFGFNEWLEDQFATAAIGAHVRQEILETNQHLLQALHVGDEAIREYVERGLTNTNKQHEFAERLDEVLGRYSRHTASERFLIQTFMPFWDWYRNALVFIYHTLPVKHPIKTGLLAALDESLHKDIDAQGNVGIARHSDLPPFLRDSVLTSGGNRVRLGHYLPFGAMANPGEGAADLLLPQLGFGSILRGQNWTGNPLTVEGDPDPTLLRMIGLAGYNALEGQAPGLSLLRRAREGGATPYDNSFAWSPKVKNAGDKREGLDLFRKLFDPFVGISRGGSKKGSGRPGDALERALKGTGGTDALERALSRAGI